LNPKLPVLQEGKPALFFTSGGQIAIQMSWSRGKRKEGLFWGWWFSGFMFWDASYWGIRKILFLTHNLLINISLLVPVTWIH